MATAPTVLIMGPPGAGKGTQATHLVDAYGLRHVSTGDLLRQAVAAGTPLGLEARRYMDAGDLVPDDVIIGMLRELVAGLEPGVGVLLDGFPRTVAQAEALDGILAELGRRIDVALDITVPDDELVRRLSSRWICRTCQRPYNAITRPPVAAGTCDDDGGELYQRTDDTAEAAVHRLAVYAADTAPLSAYYDGRGVRRTVDGAREPAAVQAALDEAMRAVTAA